MKDTIEDIEQSKLAKLIESSTQELVKAEKFDEFKMRLGIDGFSY